MIWVNLGTYATFCDRHWVLWNTLSWLANPANRCDQRTKTIEQVLSKIANEPISLHGAGVTDAGVHATNMVAHFDSSALRSERGLANGQQQPTAKKISRSNGLKRWIKTFMHASKHRHVVIVMWSITTPQRPALMHKQVTHAYYALDVAKMMQAAQKFEGTHNFESFRAAACQSNQPVRHVSHCRLIQHGSIFRYSTFRPMASYTT